MSYEFNKYIDNSKVPIDILIQNLTRKTMHYKLKKKTRKNIFSVVRMLKFKIFNNYFGVI